MTQKDFDLFNVYNKKFDEIHEKFKFWIGFQVGNIMAMFLTIGDLTKYMIALGCWLFGVIMAGIYQRQSSKVLKEMEKLVGE